MEYLASYPVHLVQEIHLAGHDATSDTDGVPLLIDAHGSEVSEDVWTLYAGVIERTGPLPTLIERDNNLPPFAELVAEARRADGIAAALKKAA
jgi:uncharacterized protein (UPF0276 family)